MPNYNQTTVTGDSWIRSNRVEIQNPFPGVPNTSEPGIKFTEEKIFNFADGSVTSIEKVPTREEDTVKAVWNTSTANTVFPLLDSLGQETGESATFSDVHNLLSSLYIFLAKRRDEAVLAAIEADLLKAQETQAIIDSFNQQTNE